jgi:hypothetical protein
VTQEVVFAAGWHVRKELSEQLKRLQEHLSPAPSASDLSLSEQLKDLDEQIKALVQRQEELQRPAPDTLGECVDNASALGNVDAEVRKAQELRRQAALYKHAEDLDKELSQLSQVFGFRDFRGESCVNKLTKKIGSLRPFEGFKHRGIEREAAEIVRIITQYGGQVCCSTIMCPLDVRSGCGDGGAGVGESEWHDNSHLLVLQAALTHSTVKDAVLRDLGWSADAAVSLTDPTRSAPQSVQDHCTKSARESVKKALVCSSCP